MAFLPVELAGCRVGVLPTFGGLDPDAATVDRFDQTVASLIGSLGLTQVDVEDRLPAPDPRLGLMGALRILGLTGEVTPEQLEVMNPEVQQAFDLLGRSSFVDVGLVDQARVRVIEAMADMFERTDLIATPTTPGEAFRADGPTEGVPAAALGPVNISGYAAITLPMGVGPSGLPLGIQLIGRPFSESLLLEVGHRWEAIAPWPLVAPGSPW